MEHVTSPEQVVFLGIGFVVACVGIGLWLYFGVRGQPVHDESTGDLMRRAAQNVLHWRPSAMSSEDDSIPAAAASISAEDRSTLQRHIPVSHTDIYTSDHTSNELPHFDRDITDGEWIIRMACARGPDKKYRFSANAIYAAVGGDRNAVLARIREIRATPPPAEYMQPDGTKVPASHPITGRAA